MAHSKEQNEVKENSPEEARNIGLDSHGLLNYLKYALTSSAFNSNISTNNLVANYRMSLAIQVYKD